MKSPGCVRRPRGAKGLDRLENKGFMSTNRTDVVEMKRLGGWEELGKLEGPVISVERMEFSGLEVL